MLDMHGYMGFDYDDTLLNAARHLGFDGDGHGPRNWFNVSLVDGPRSELIDRLRKGGNLSD